MHPGALARSRRGGGFIAGHPAPAPSCQSRPAPPRLPAASFVCQRAAASPRPHAGTPPLFCAASRISPPRGHRRVTVPRKRQETRRPRGAAPAWAALHVGRADPGVGGRRRDPRAPGASLGRWASGLRCPLGETGERLGTVPVGPGDGDNGARSRPGRGKSSLEVLSGRPRATGTRSGSSSP